MAGNDFAALWDDARKQYAEATGKDLKEIPMPQSTEDLIQNVEKQNAKYSDFRRKQVRWYY